jgi:hypothetical protein
MGFNKISVPGYKNYNPPLTVTLAPGEVWLIPAGQGVVGTFGATGTQLTGFTLSGQYFVDLGMYTVIQYYDPNLQVWRHFGGAGSDMVLSSDGTNFRLANLTGCPIGAVVTTIGSGYTNGFNTVTCTPSAGSSTWNTIVGGSINTTVTITTAGTNYSLPPILVFNPPANQGSTPYVLPTATCTLTSGGIGAVTVVNQGAGLVAAPTIVVMPQPGDTTGGGAVLTVNASLTNSGKLLWVGMATPGSALTAVPTFSSIASATGYTGGSGAAATILMDFTITGITVTTGGGGYPASTNFPVVIGANPVAASTAVINPYTDVGMVQPRVAQLNMVTTTSSGAFTTASVNIADAGHGFPCAPTGILPYYYGVTGQAVLTPTVGGQTDTSLIYPL